MIRNYVSNDHIESIGEIAKSQSAIIQALSLDNSKLEREIERLNNIINELEKYLIEDNYKNEDVWCITTQEVLNKLQELKGSDKEWIGTLKIKQ